MFGTRHLWGLSFSLAFKFILKVKQMQKDAVLVPLLCHRLSLERTYIWKIMMFFACMCPHYSAVIRHHYYRFDHYTDCFLCEPLTAVLMREHAVCNMRKNVILRLGVTFSSRPKVFPANKELRRLCQRPGNYYE